MLVEFGGKGSLDVVCERIDYLFVKNVVSIITIFEMKSSNGSDIIETGNLVTQRPDFIAKGIQLSL